MVGLSESFVMFLHQFPRSTGIAPRVRMVLGLQYSITGMSQNVSDSPAVGLEPIPKLLTHMPD